LVDVEGVEVGADVFDGGEILRTGGVNCWDERGRVRRYIYTCTREAEVSRTCSVLPGRVVVVVVPLMIAIAGKFSFFLVVMVRMRLVVASWFIYRWYSRWLTSWMADPRCLG
jgi:hypothetical protein